MATEQEQWDNIPYQTTHEYIFCLNRMLKALIHQHYAIDQRVAALDGVNEHKRIQYIAKSGALDLKIQQVNEELMHFDHRNVNPIIRRGV